MPPALLPPNVDTREALLDAALLCFAKYGYEATSTRLVASMAGKNVSLISHHFGNKEGLYRAVIQHMLAHFSKVFPECGFPMATFGAPRQCLRAYIRWFLSDLEDAPHPQDPRWDAARRLMLSELHFPKAEVRDLLQAHLGDSIQALRGIIRAIRPDLGTAEVDFWGLTVQGCCLTPLFEGFNNLIWPGSKPFLDLEELAERFTDLIHIGLTRDEGRPFGSPRLFTPPRSLK